MPVLFLKIYDDYTSSLSWIIPSTWTKWIQETSVKGHFWITVIFLEEPSSSWENANFRISDHYQIMVSLGGAKVLKWSILCISWAGLRSFRGGQQRWALQFFDRRAKKKGYFNMVGAIFWKWNLLFLLMCNIDTEFQMFQNLVGVHLAVIMILTKYMM